MRLRRPHRRDIEALLSRRLDDVRLLMLDGIELKGRTNSACLGITTEGQKVPLGLREGSTENAVVATALLAHLVDRGLDMPRACSACSTGPGRCARRSASPRNLDPDPALHPKERNVLEHLTERDRPAVRGRLRRTLASTNPCESMIEGVRRTSRNVKRWQSGEMCLHWTAAGMLEAERQFRKVVGDRDLAKLAVGRTGGGRESLRTTRSRPLRFDRQLGPPPKVHGDRDMLAGEYATSASWGSSAPIA